MLDAVSRALIENTPTNLTMAKRRRPTRDNQEITGPDEGERVTHDGEDTTVECILTIKGRDFDPARIDAALAIEPTRVWRQHHAHLLARQDLANIAWQSSVGPKSFASIEEPICMLLDRFHPHAEALRELTADLDAQVSLECVAIVRSAPPAYVLTASTMRRMVDLNTDFGLAVFDRRE